MIGISGTNGFIGRYVVNELKKRGIHNYIQWNRNTDGDILDPINFAKFIHKYDIYSFLHLAWASTSANNYENSEENTKHGIATLKIIHECIENDIYFMTIGSISAMETEMTNYGRAKHNIQMKLNGATNSALYIPGYIFSIPDERPRLLREYFQRGTEFRLRKPGEIVNYVEVRDVAKEVAEIFLNSKRGTYSSKLTVPLKNKDFIDLISQNLDKGSTQIKLDGESYTELMLRSVNT